MSDVTLRDHPLRGGADDRVATITLNRPEVLNAFDRQMCEEMRDVWHVVKADDRVNAVVLRAAGDRAFSAGLDTSKSFGQPDIVWNHDDPGEFLSPKWQKCWKPVVCAVQGMCTAGALYFVNEADVVICSDDATFFDSHVTYGYVSALEPIGLMRRIGLGDTLRMALMGNRERVSAETALRLGLVTEVVPRDQLWDHAPRAGAARSRRTRRSRRRARSARSGSRSTSRTAPRWTRASCTRASATRSALAEIAAHRHRPHAAHGPMSESDDAPSRSASARSWRSIPSAPALEFEGVWSTWGELPARGRPVDAVLARPRSRCRGAGRAHVPQPSGALGTLLGLLRAGACVVTVNPLLGAERLRADVPGSVSRCCSARPTTSSWSPADDAADDRSGRARCARRADRGHAVEPAAPAVVDAPGVAVRMLTSGTTGPPKRIDLATRCSTR